MLHKVDLFLHTDNIDWLDKVAKGLANKHHRDVSRSEACNYVIHVFWKDQVKRLVDQRHADKVQDRLKGSALIRPGLKKKRNGVIQ